MLRPIRTTQPSTRLIPFKTTTATADSVTIGKDNFSVRTGASAAQFTPTFAQAARRRCTAVATPYDDITAGGAVITNTGAQAFSATTPGSFYSVDNTGSADNGTIINGLCVLNDSTYETLSPALSGARFDVKSRHPGARILPFYCTGGSSPVLTVGSSYGSVTYSGTAEWTITFSPAFGSDDVIALATAVGTKDEMTISSVDRNTVVVKSYSYSGSPEITSFNLVVFGSSKKAGLDHYGKYSPVMCPLLKPRLINCSYSTGTTTTFDVGAADVSMTHQGSFVRRITFTKAFGLTPVIVGMGGFFAYVVSQSTTTADVLIYDNTGAGVSADDNSFLIIGSDAPYEV